MIPEPFLSLGISLGLGLLVGLQREKSKSELAGIRTFPLITLLGTLCAMLGDWYGGWVPAAGLLALGGVVVGANLLRRGQEGATPGMTTEIAIFVMFAVGALAHIGPISAAVAIGGVVVVLLHFKNAMHGLGTGWPETRSRARLHARGVFVAGHFNGKA